MSSCVLTVALAATNVSAQAVIDFQTWREYLEGRTWEGECATIMADALEGFNSSSEDDWSWVNQFSNPDVSDTAIGATYFLSGDPFGVELLTPAHGYYNVITGQYNVDISSSRVLRTVIEEAYHWHNGPNNYGDWTHDELRDKIKTCVEGQV